MKGASRQTRWIYLEVHRDFSFRSAEPPDRASLVVSKSDSWHEHEPVTIELAGFKSSTTKYGTQAWHIQNTCPYGRCDSKHLASDNETLTEPTSQCAEIDCWSRSISALSNLAVNSSTRDTVNSVNRLIDTWPGDDALSTEGFEGIKANYKKLMSGLNDIKAQSDRDVKYTRVDMTS
jgi:hypothetical protein